MNQHITITFTNTAQDSTKDRQSAQEIFDSYFRGGADGGGCPVYRSNMWHEPAI